MKSKRLLNKIAIILFILISFLLMFYSNNNINNNNSINNERNNGLFRKLLSNEDNPQDIEREESIDINKSVQNNCTKPSIESFPRISSELRRSALMSIICCVIIIHTFIAISIICDEYFVPSLQVLCDKLRLESDVAGSTFMAAGSSAPELAASVIGVFVAQDDIGVGTVVGSAVFNIAFVISICALFAGSVVRINWWPIVRDSFFYLVSICVLFIAMFDSKVTLFESIVFLLVYVFYILFMAYNKLIEKKVLQKYKHFLRQPNDESSSLVSYRQISELDKSMDTESCVSITEIESKSIKVDYMSSKPLERQFTTNSQKSCLMNLMRNAWNIIIYPINVVLWLTIPDCSNPDKHKWFVITFVMSCVWISVFSYLMVWMITIIGFNLQIPDTVMGLVFIAAGASLPDAVASLIVVREGLGDMALTNAIASNVFDILICLGLPWFIKTAFVNPGSSVPVISRGLEYSTISLLSTVVFFLVITHMNGWKLDRKYGIILMIWYIAFMVMACLYELNVFGQFNPPICLTQF